MANVDEYEYGKTFTITTTRAALGIPPPNKIFGNKIFSVVLLNTGATDITVYPINSQGASNLEVVVPAGGGELAEEYGWSTIAGGFEAVASLASSTLSIQLYSRDGPIQATPPVIPISIIPIKRKVDKRFIQVKTFQVS